MRDFLVSRVFSFKWARNPSMVSVNQGPVFASIKTSRHAFEHRGPLLSAIVSWGVTWFLL